MFVRTAIQPPDALIGREQCLSRPAVLELKPFERACLGDSGERRCGGWLKLPESMYD